MKPAASDPIPWHPFAAFCAWLIPGLGHVLIGQGLRGLILFFTITGLFVSGVVLGGVDVFDRSKHAIVFFSQAAIAPTIPASIMLRTLKATTSDFRPDNHPPYTPALGKSEEQGSLFTGVAGLLNMLAIMDVFYREPRRRSHKKTGTNPATGTDPEASAGTPPPEPTPPTDGTAQPPPSPQSA